MLEGKDTYLDTVSAEAQHIESGSNIDTIVKNTFEYDTRRLNIGRAAITTFAIISAGYIGGYLVNLGGAAAVAGGSIQIGVNGYVAYQGGKTVYESAPKAYEAFKNGHTIEALKYTGITTLGVLGVVTGGVGVVTGVKNISKVVSPLLKGPSVSVGDEGGSGSLIDIDKIRPQLKTEPDTAFFWSGRTDGVGGANTAADIAKSRGGVTLETTIDANKIEMPEWDFNNPSTMEAWDVASRAYAEQASGEIRAVVGSKLRQGNIWENVELPGLLNNPNVTKITIIDPKTQIETIIFKR